MRAADHARLHVFLLILTILLHPQPLFPRWRVPQVADKVLTTLSTVLLRRFFVYFFPLTAVRHPEAQHQSHTSACLPQHYKWTPLHPATSYGPHTPCSHSTPLFAFLFYYAPTLSTPTPPQLPLLSFAAILSPLYLSTQFFSSTLPSTLR